ncbi:MAG: DUF2207 domain-containing protein [Halobacteriota archaeon]
MSETRQLATIVGIGLVLAIIALIIVSVAGPATAGSLSVSNYDATLTANGTLTEKITYNVAASDTYRSLNRWWEAPVTNNSSQPYIRLTSIAPAAGTEAYLVNASGHVTVWANDYNALSAIESNANNNEAGMYNGNYYDAGLYTGTYTWVVHPPLEYDAAANLTHLDLLLAGDSHVTYDNVRITIPANNITWVYAYPPTLYTEKVNDTYVITGSLAANENLAVEELGTPAAFSQLNGFQTNVSNVQGLTAAAASQYDSVYSLANILNELGRIAVIAVPLLLVALYVGFSREKSFTVPDYLSTMPEMTLKPWQVNLLFKADPLDFDKDGYYATLLELHRRKVIEISGEGANIKIRILSRDVSDPYEQRVLAFIDAISADGFLDSEYITSVQQQALTDESAKNTAASWRKSINEVTNTVDPSIARDYVTSGKRRFRLPLLISGALGVFSILFYVSYPDVQYILGAAAIFWIVVFVQFLVARFAPSTLFGRWKGDHYKEKLEWDSFNHFLKDMAKIGKSPPKDVSIWGDWLIYGTALGDGQAVEEAMQKFNVKLVDAGMPDRMWSMNTAMDTTFYTMMTFGGDSGGDSGGGSSDDFGGDSGFGGGGAGGW